MAFTRMRRVMRLWRRWLRRRLTRLWRIKASEGELMMTARILALAGLGFITASALGQTGQTAPSAVVPVVPVSVDTAKEIAAMEAKLADWPQLGRYREANKALPPVAQGEDRVVFYGDSI